MTKNIAIFLLILLSISIFLLFDSKLKNQRDSYEQNEVQFFETIKLKDSSLAYQQRKILDTQGEINKLLEENSRIKNLSNRVEFRVLTQVKRDTIYLSDTVKILVKDNRSFLPLPFSVSKRDKFYGYDFSITEKGDFVQDSLWFESDFTVNFGTEKRKFFNRLLKPDVHLVEVNILNPYSHVTQMKNFSLKEKRRRLGLGLNLSYSFNGSMFSPSVGAGLNYNIIQF